ncbi:hypothetical protein BJV82DRAFT_664270 [Fennellomyces sp. T-0311]|nr:hypothetical protein BJV82DRAFT_664270 [Fennellomyces sp. T-0311]
MDLEKKYARLRQIHKDQLVTNSLQNRLIDEYKGTIEHLEETVSKIDARLKEVEKANKYMTQQLEQSIDERSHLNNRIKQQSDTIADLREFIAERIGIEGLDAFDRRPPLHDIINEDEDDETTDEQSDPLLPPNDDENMPLSPRNEQPYVETVRKKAERAQLIGTACKNCADFYYAAGPLPGPDGKLITPEERIQLCSRHRSRFERPRTPPGFWELDFISTQEFEKQAQRQKRRK